MVEASGAGGGGVCEPSSRRTVGAAGFWRWEPVAAPGDSGRLLLWLPLCKRASSATALRFFSSSSSSPQPGTEPGQRGVKGSPAVCCPARGVAWPGAACCEVSVVVRLPSGVEGSVVGASESGGGDV